MKVTKKVIDHLNKCYSIAPLTYQGKEHILVAAEKQDPCYLYNREGNKVDTVWEGPGGVMSMVQVPGQDGCFLATHRFYSPNDSKEAKIVLVTAKDQGNWEVRTLVELPHVHRFDIVTRNGVNYLIACTLKSGHEYKEDWSMPGKVYGAVLPEDLSIYSEENQLKLTVLKDNMLKNHGYYKVEDQGIDTSIISADCGVFQFIPPASKEERWEIKTLLSEAASDAVLVDFDEDGEKELLVLAPFHGEHIGIYKKIEGEYQKVYDYEEAADFTHAIYGGTLLGKPAAVVGHRKGKRNLIAFTYNKETAAYESEILDFDCGSANVYHYEKDGKDILIGANREIDEIAMYTIEA